MTIQQAFNKLKAELPNILEGYARASKVDMLTEIDLNFDKPSESEIYRVLSTRASIKPNTGERLRLVTGALLNSYNPKDKNSASTIKVQNYILTEVYESLLPYAGVHETGGGNNIPARPYLAPAEKAHLEGQEERIKEYILDEIAKIFK